MARKLTPSVVQGRLRDYVANHYLMLISVVKGVVLGAAAFVLVTAFNDPSTIVPRLAFWLASLAAALISYVTWSRGVLMTNEKYNIYDAAWPLAMGIAEILLFAILAPNDDHPRLWWNWYLVFAAHVFCAFLLTGNRIRQTDIIADYDDSIKNATGESMQDLAREYLKWVRSDHRETMWISIVATLGWILMRWVVLPQWPWTVTGQTVFGLIIFAALLKKSRNVVAERTRIDEFINYDDTTDST